MLDPKIMEEALTTLLGQMTRFPDPETPRRATKYWIELLQGECYTNTEIAAMYNKTFPCKTHSIVTVNAIPTFSHCEHHLALMYDASVSISYIPKDKVLGLSKFGRIVSMCSKRLQLQERLTQDIWDVLHTILDTMDIKVSISAKHACMTARGIQDRESYTETVLATGSFES